MQSSRRNFLLGRRSADATWALFLQTLSSRCQGQVEDMGVRSSGGGQARLTPTREGEVTQARTVCAAHGVAMVLEGVTPLQDDGRPWLLLNPVKLTELVRLEGVVPRWRAQPGVSVATLAQAGMSQFCDLPGEMSLAHWLAAPAMWPTGACAASGLLAVDVMLADGTEETLGPFGEADVRPLRSNTLQQLVPALFQLSHDPDVRLCSAAQAWVPRYRLDALSVPGAVNLAHLVLGQGGTLAWVQQALLVATSSRPSVQRDTAPAQAAAQRVVARVKALFDPMRRFPDFKNMIEKPE